MALERVLFWGGIIASNHQAQIPKHFRFFKVGQKSVAYFGCQSTKSISTVSISMGVSLSKLAQVVHVLVKIQCLLLLLRPFSITCTCAASATACQEAAR